MGIEEPARATSTANHSTTYGSASMDVTAADLEVCEASICA